MNDYFDENKVYTRTQKYFTFSSDKGIESTVKGLKIASAVFLLIAVFGFLVNIVMAIETPVLILGALISGGFFGFFGVMSIKLLKSIGGEYEKFLVYVDEERKKDRLKYEKFKKEHPYWEEEQFYIKMRDEGIENVDSKANIARLKLVAKNNGIKKAQEDLIRDFNIGKSEIERIELKEKNSKTRKEERALDAEYNKYINLIGRKKSEQIIEENIKEYQAIISGCNSDAESVMNGGQSFYLNSRQKESSWAVHGGIASGIAGVGAGVAAAVNTELRNIEKREHNEKILNATASVITMQLQQIWKIKHEAEDELEYWEKEKVKNQKRLIENIDENILLSKLRPEVIKFENSATGAVKISVDVYGDSKFKIYDNAVKAAIDGSIEVSLAVDGEVVGTAVRVLPYQGISCRQNIEFICRKVKNQAEEYTFIFKPVHLWGVEDN